MQTLDGRELVVFCRLRVGKEKAKHRCDHRSRSRDHAHNQHTCENRNQRFRFRKPHSKLKSGLHCCRKSFFHYTVCISRQGLSGEFCGLLTFHFLHTGFARLDAVAHTFFAALRSSFLHTRIISGGCGFTLLYSAYLCLCRMGRAVYAATCFIPR